MKFILGEKQKMTQIFDEDGTVHPVTAISAGPITVTQIKTKEKDGYEAIQVGYGKRNEKNINKAQVGHTKGSGNYKVFREFPVTEAKIGEKIDVDVFEKGDVVTVSSISKGKGFQGGVKRYGFKGGSRTHGQKHSEREIGSIGATGPQRVFKGQRMPGRMGTDRISVKNLKVVAVDKDNQTIFIKGAIPGRRGTLVEIVA